MEPSKIADAGIGALGAIVASCPWTQILTGVEAVIAGGLTIVLLCVRIKYYMNKR